MSGAPAQLDRRPIAARRLPVFAAMAAALARRGVRPNAISVAGMLATVLAGVLLAVSGGLSVLYLAMTAGVAYDPDAWDERLARWEHELSNPDDPDSAATATAAHPESEVPAWW